jgi:hypothetical protein
VRVNLEYKMLSVFKGLKPYAFHESTGMEWLETIPTIKDYSKKGLATHIVTGIQVNDMIRQTLNG